jgi:hypothetical protein
VADPGHDQAVGRRCKLGIRGYRDLRAGPGDRTLRGANVARSVVEDDNRRHRAPLVLGTPSTRGSMAIASLSVPCERLELTFDDVVRVATRDHRQVQVDLCVEGERLHHVPRQRPT